MLVGASASASLVFSCLLYTRMHTDRSAPKSRLSPSWLGCYAPYKYSELQAVDSIPVSAIRWFELAHLSRLVWRWLPRYAWLATPRCPLLTSLRRSRTEKRGRDVSDLSCCIVHTLTMLSDGPSLPCHIVLAPIPQRPSPRMVFSSCSSLMHPDIPFHTIVE